MRSSLARLRPPTNHSHPPHILLGASYRPKSTTTTTTTTTTNAPFSPPPPQSPSFSPSAYLEAAARKFASTPPILTRDVLSPTPSRLLTLSLADHCPALFPPLPPSHDGGSSNNDKGDGNGNADLPSFPMLPQGHHLVYFPLQRPPSQLMPDGTDPAHSPGPPFVRRMWAGGEVVFRGGWERELRVDGRPVGCLERVGGRPVFKEGKGKGDGEGKVFVEVRREYGVLRDGGGGLGGETGGVIEEVRRLVFLRERGGHRAGERKVAEEGRKGVRVPYTPEFTYSLKPDATLLFHFSALTYNAHAIHLNPEYARDVEGYKGLLVHGPLSLVLMLAALRASLVQLQTASVAGNPLRMPYVKLIRYSNLAPLYVDEEMKVCLRRTRPEGDELGWDVWIEGPEGGLAVKGTAVTTGVR
ncbi:Hydroxyacyl-thioester dehydratase type 2, mitochondrial [Madurella mycetomatis]|uniref:Hydroxyacyl-thioester dehydratase type 2, mitochondrial n=1 Tax=Madurella mycetomatis TaxID=100816 RepID=A0A175WFI5_9PEZI|nr:Hydroxyacyl-thioester dehydratase type 2, mitochondrial [Madurella mycetomatis]